jgi:tetratricopeptide (TPR) repeat protein
MSFWNWLLTVLRDKGDDVLDLAKYAWKFGIRATPLLADEAITLLKRYFKYLKSVALTCLIISACSFGIIIISLLLQTVFSSEVFNIIISVGWIVIGGAAVWLLLMAYPIMVLADAVVEKIAWVKRGAQMIAAAAFWALMVAIWFYITPVQNNLKGVPLVLMATAALAIGSYAGWIKLGDGHRFRQLLKIQLLCIIGFTCFSFFFPGITGALFERQGDIDEETAGIISRPAKEITSEWKNLQWFSSSKAHRPKVWYSGDEHKGYRLWDKKGADPYDTGKELQPVKDEETKDRIISYFRTVEDGKLLQQKKEEEHKQREREEARQQQQKEEAKQQEQRKARLQSLNSEASDAFKKGDYDAAIKTCDEAIALDSSSAALFTDRGSAKSKLSDRAGAIADYRKALELKPHYERARKSLSEELCGQAVDLNGKGDYAAVIKAADEAIDVDAANASAFNERGIAKNHLADRDSATADFRRALQLKPDFDRAKVNLVSILKGQADDSLARRDYAVAVKTCDELIALNPANPALFTTRGVAKSRLGDRSGAMADFQKALQLKPDDSLAQQNLTELTQAAYRAAATPEENLARFPVPKLKTESDYVSKPEAGEPMRVAMTGPRTTPVENQETVRLSAHIRDQYVVAPAGRYSTPVLMPLERVRFDYDCGNHWIVVRVNGDRQREVTVARGSRPSLGHDVQQLQFQSLEDQPVQVRITMLQQRPR